MNPKSDYEIVLLPGDGIGVEVINEARLLLESIAPKLEVGFSLQEIPCGGEFYLDNGERDWPEGSESKCDNADVVILGAVGYPSPTGVGPVTMKDGRMAGYSPVIGNRLRMDLYANIRRVKLLPGVLHNIAGTMKSVWSHEDVDMVILRENTEGLYAGMGGTLSPGGVGSVAADTRVITRAASERIIRRAFELCELRGKGAPLDGKKRVTCIAKDNVLDGCKLFVQVFREIGEEYPQIEKDYAIVDAFTQWLVTRPNFYDVCVTTNMFGDIVTDLASVLQGGMGMAVGCNVGDDKAMFEPIHGSAPPLAGKDKANPIATLLATSEALLWLGQKYKDSRLIRGANAIESAVGHVCEQGNTLPADLVGEEKAVPMSMVGAAIREQTLSLLSS